MYLTVASYKGGVGKSITAIHLAAYLSERGKTLLVDGDPNRSASRWARRGTSELPFRVLTDREATRQLRDFEHVVIDTQARPGREDLEALAAGCDLLVVPTTPDAFSIDALMATVLVLKELNAPHYRVLLTRVPPRPSRDGEEAREQLAAAGVPLFAADIPRLSAFDKVALQGVTVNLVEGDRAARDRAWSAYEALGKEILP